jgi:response regulator RpfG family c-di-GMP phosphodiesterase
MTPHERTFERQSVIVVDDEAPVRDLLSRWLESSGYSVTAVGDAEAALGLLRVQPAAVALCDVRMPGRDGLWLAGELRRQFPETAVIVATGVRDADPRVASVRAGVVDCLTKPFGRDRLCAAVGRAVEWHQRALEARHWREGLEADMLERRARLARLVSAAPVDSDEAVEALWLALTAGHPDVHAHGRRTAELTLSLAGALGLASGEATVVARAARLHDLGKLAMPDAIVRKPAPLAAEELALLRTHPQIGHELIAGVPFLASAASLVRDAQERLDGLGHPRGLRGDAIPWGARIVAVADAYDTMTHPRVFCDPLPHAQAILELDRCRGTQFDPAVADAFLRAVS